MAYPRYQRARQFKFVRRTSANVTVGTTWAAVDTALDLVLEAQIGDVLEASVNGLWDVDGPSGTLDVATIVSNTAVTYFGSGTATQSGNGVVGWFGTGGQYSQLAGSAFLTVTAEDLVGGMVTVRLLARGSAVKSLLASSVNPLLFAVKNLGPADPN